MVTERVALPKVFVSPEAKAGWEAFCDAYGVTRSGLMEACGLILIDVVAGTLEITPATYAVIARAKAIDQERRRRV